MSTDLIATPTRTGLETLTGPQRDAAVTAYLVDARDRLHLALEAIGPEAAQAFKAEVSVVAEMSRQVNVSKEIQADAHEMVRRALFALGKAVRVGQERGEIRKHSQTITQANQHGVADRGVAPNSGPDDYFSNSDERTDAYAMSDGVTPDEFEAALTEARAEGNLSRANVVRKVKERTHAEQRADKWDRVSKLADQGWASADIAAEVGMTNEGLRSGARREGIEFPADYYTRNHRRIDSAEVIRRTITNLEGLCMGLHIIDLNTLEDEGEAQTWIDSLTASIRTLQKVNRQIRESLS